MIDTMPHIAVYPCVSAFSMGGIWDLAQHIIHTLVKATVFESVCHFRTQVSAIATHFLQTVFSTVHYMISLCQISTVLSVLKKAETQIRTTLVKENVV